MSAEHGSHSTAHGHDDHAAHTGIYKKIGGVLLVCTVITVLISLFKIETVAFVVALGLAVAAFKASLVAAIFMHLKDEKKVIWWTLALCAVFFVILIFLPVFTVEEGVGHSIAPEVQNLRKHEAAAEGGHQVGNGEAAASGAEHGAAAGSAPAEPAH